MTRVTKILEEMDDLATRIGRGNNLNKGTVIAWELKFKSLIVQLRGELGLGERAIAPVATPDETAAIDSS